MSSPTEGNGKKDDHSAYAPKWVRDSNRETSHENPSIGEDKFHQRSEQSFPERGPASDQARVTFARGPLHIPRSLEPEFLKERPPAPRALGRLAAVAGLIMAASVGAAIALFATGKFPSELNKVLDLTTDKTAVVSNFAADTLKTPEQPSSAAAQPTITSTVRACRRTTPLLGRAGKRRRDEA